MRFGLTDVVDPVRSLDGTPPGHRDLCIAVLDGPVDLSHPAFAESVLSVVPAAHPTPPVSGKATDHGTHVASILFGHPDGPVPGLAHRCRGVIVPIYGQTAEGGVTACSQTDLAWAIGIALDRGAHIINISGGENAWGGQAEPVLADAVRRCERHGAVVVAAAGNDGCDCLHVPAALDGVLAVGAMDRGGVPLDGSNWGEAYRRNGVLVCGAEIAGAQAGGGVAHRTGTSFAAAIATGLLARLTAAAMTHDPIPDPRAARAAILASAVGCNGEGEEDCRRVLAGRLDVSAALKLMLKKGEFSMSESDIMSEAMDVLAVAPAIETPIAVMPAGQDAAPAAVAPSEGAETAPNCRLCADKATVPAAAASADRSKVYVLGQIGYDFVNQARRDAYRQHTGLANVDDEKAMLKFLKAEPSAAAGMVWLLKLDGVPLYAVEPSGPFAATAYDRVREFLEDQIEGKIERTALAGYISGAATVAGNNLPLVVPVLRGMSSWTTKALIDEVKKVLGGVAAETARSAESEIGDFLIRIYHELRNTGTAPSDRALNFAATNAVQAAKSFASAVAHGLRLADIDVVKTPIARPGTDCWDVRLTFFHPTKRMEHAHHVHRFTIDVSDVVPVTVGDPKNWVVA